MYNKGNFLFPFDNLKRKKKIIVQLFFFLGIVLGKYFCDLFLLSKELAKVFVLKLTLLLSSFFYWGFWPRGLRMVLPPL